MHVDFHGACGVAIFSWSARVTTARTRLTQIEPIHAPACSIGSVRANILTARSTAGSTRRPAIDVGVIGCRSCQCYPPPPTPLTAAGGKGTYSLVYPALFTPSLPCAAVWSLSLPLGGPWRLLAAMNSVSCHSTYSVHLDSLLTP